eukprot:gnl/TRDRNA2_/TRDRNA2_159799_c1_seq1.p1 gnl/TRDRNA2_/TRDRNA2_159799_c1~~gnl/TRDRNA2_/TRDRNA2_159799_c1_seq1.p1  ORF type:complete len:334 (+),score=63.37 gnl/TRDRNA2_/TRDRNA2_159799_c1_seq1:24-1004(+)
MAASAHRLGQSRQERTTELHKAAVAGDKLRLAALMGAGVDVEAANEYGQTALFLSALNGHSEALRELLAWGADPQAAAHGGSTPAVVAAANGHADALQLLEAAGADLLHTGSGGFTAADYRKGLARAATTVLPDATVTVLIDSGMDHAGAGSCWVDDAFSEEFLMRIEELFWKLPVAERTKACTSDRSYFCDSEGWVQHAFAEACGRASSPSAPVNSAMAQMRFLHYSEPGGGLAPHIDLARTDAAGQRSTHTFILYLADCTSGGETVLLEHMASADAPVLCEVPPRRGRLLLFPHQCPHLARPTVEVPKLLLRGEMYFSAAVSLE